MRAEALLLSVVLLATGCAAVAPVERHRSPGPVLRQSAPGAPPERVQRHQGTRGAGLGEQRDDARTHQAVLQVIDEVRGSTGSAEALLARLASRPPGMGNRGLSGLNGVFTRSLEHGSRQLPWLRSELGGARVLTEAASQADDPDMRQALLRMAGSRVQSAMFGAMLLTAWLDFLQLADAVLRQYPAYGVETLFLDMVRVQRRMEPALEALASQDSGRVEAAATAMPELMGELTREFGAIRDGAHTAMERAEKVMAVVQLVEMLTLVSTLKMSLPRLPPAAPATLGMGMVMGSGGVMVGTRIVVSAEWVERMRRLVQAGVISVPVASAAVRIHGGQVLMAQGNGDLPKGVRDALGDGPEVRGMHETGRSGAGMADAPKHHVLPREHRAWFEQRGFKGDMDIDQFCVRLEPARHQAIHGGGDWRLGRMWPGEWNRMIMEALREAEADAGRMLTRKEVLNIVSVRMKLYDIPMNFILGRKR